MGFDEGIIFVLAREDVIACAREMGIAEEAITDDVLYQVKKGVEFGLACPPHKALAGGSAGQT